MKSDCVNSAEKLQMVVAEAVVVAAAAAAQLSF